MTPKEKAMSNREQSSLDFYRTELMALVSTGKTEYKTEPEIYEQAKELHKQEIIDAYNEGLSNWDSEQEAEQYYNEIFKQ